jgi:hypothetical protein
MSEETKAKKRDLKSRRKYKSYSKAINSKKNVFTKFNDGIIKDSDDSDYDEGKDTTNVMLEENIIRFLERKNIHKDVIDDYKGAIYDFLMEV